jgi:hypothetical protein
VHCILKYVFKGLVLKYSATSQTSSFFSTFQPHTHVLSVSQWQYNFVPNASCTLTIIQKTGQYFVWERALANAVKTLRVPQNADISSSWKSDSFSGRTLLLGVSYVIWDGTRGGRSGHKQLLDGLKKMRWYWKLKEEVLACTRRRTRSWSYRKTDCVMTITS